MMLYDNNSILHMQRSLTGFIMGILYMQIKCLENCAIRQIVPLIEIILNNRISYNTIYNTQQL